MRRLESSAARVRAIHPYAWLWEPLEREPTFVLRPMFGAKSVYLHGKIVLAFVAREEPWRGVLVATERTQHAALIADFPDLRPHPILPKWLYLSEGSPHFERTAAALATLARKRDPRIGVVPKPKKKSAQHTHRLPDHP